MRILVLVKPTLDVTQIKYGSSGEPIIDVAPLKMGDSDKCALEEAIRLKEGHGAHVVVATVGWTPESERIIRDAYAMGADEGYVIKVDDPGTVSAPSVAEAVCSLSRRLGQTDLILLGAGSLDTHSYLLGPLVASMLNVPIIACADSLRYVDGAFEAECIMEDGAYVYRARPPLVVTVTTEANEPRIPTLKTILKSKKMEVKTVTLEELGVSAKRIAVTDVKRYTVQRRRILWDAGEDVEKAVDNLYRVLVAEGVVG